MVVRHDHQADQGAIGRRCARPRHVHDTRLTGRSRSHRAQRSRQLLGVALRVRHRRSQSPPLASSLDSTTAISCRAGAVSRCTLPFLRKAPLRLANGGAGQQRSSTDHHHATTAHLCVCREIAVSRSGNCRLAPVDCWCYSSLIPAAILVLFLRYSCVILALFLRCACVILALFRCYSGLIPLVIPSAPPPSVDLGVRERAHRHLEVLADELFELLGVEISVARLVVALEQLLQRHALRRRLELLLQLARGRLVDRTSLPAASLLLRSAKRKQDYCMIP